MGRIQPAAEVRKEFTNKMGQDLGTIYYELWNECAFVHVEWDEFKELYGTGQKRVVLLNTAAGPFFRLVQDKLMDSILLHLCRMTDPAATGGKTNLTLEQLAALIKDHNQAFGQKVSRLAADAKSTCQFARDSRDRRIAHRDLALALGKNSRPLASINVGRIHNALKGIAAVIQEVSIHYFNRGVAFDAIPRGAVYATSLLCVLRDGVKAQRSRKERLMSGRPIPEDLQRPEKI